MAGYRSFGDFKLATPQVALRAYDLYLKGGLRYTEADLKVLEENKSPGFHLGYAFPKKYIVMWQDGRRVEQHNFEGYIIFLDYSNSEIGKFDGTFSGFDISEGNTNYAHADKFDLKRLLDLRALVARV